MLEGKQYIRRNFSCCVVYWFSYICLIGPDFDFSSFIIGEGVVQARSILMIRWRSTASLKLEGMLELPERLRVALDVHEHVMGLVDLRERESQLAPAPVLEPVDLAVLRCHRRTVTLDHRRDLLALVRVDDETHLVMSHHILPMDKAARWVRRCDATEVGAAGLKTNDRRGGRRGGEF